jgi:hypothetical protein
VVAAFWILSELAGQLTVFERDFYVADPVINHPHRKSQSVGHIFAEEYHFSLVSILTQDWWNFKSFHCTFGACSNSCCSGIVSPFLCFVTPRNTRPSCRSRDGSGVYERPEKQVFLLNYYHFTSHMLEQQSWSGILIFVVLLNLHFTSGRLRPDFLARCKWDEVAMKCTG